MLYMLQQRRQTLTKSPHEIPLLEKLGLYASLQCGYMTKHGYASRVAQQNVAVRSAEIVQACHHM